MMMRPPFNIAPAGRPALLISVRSTGEALAALRGGADWIDIKEPARGPLGMASPEVTAAIVAMVGGVKPVSAALGELKDLPGGRSICESLDYDPGRAEGVALSYIKVGLAQAPSDWRAQLHSRSWPAPLIAVAYADFLRVNAPSVRQVTEFVATGCCSGLLIDTAIKDGQCLFDLMDESSLVNAIAAVHRAGKIVALAGSLKGRDLLRAAALRPDIIAVRGAACRGHDRQQSIDEARVGELHDVIAAHSAAAVARAN